MLKCQSCGQQGTHHVTEIVAGKAVEYHVCETHVHDLASLPPGSNPCNPMTGIQPFWDDPELREALCDPAACQGMAAHLLPALCLALLHQALGVRIVAAYTLMRLGANARPAVGALRDALRDPDGRVALAAAFALEYIDSAHVPPPSFL
jgi:hypothetical protein